MKKSLPIIISLILGIVVGAGGMYLGNRYKGPDLSTAKTYKTFTNETQGITFSYSSEYTIEEKDPTPTRHSIVLVRTADKLDTKRTEGPTSITIDLFKNALSKKKTLGDWVKSAPESNFKLSSDGFAASTTIAGLPALTYSWDGLYAANSVVIDNKGTVVMVSMTYITTTDPIWQDFARVLQSLQLK